jgi:capsular polysaccharide biosynthesis protein
LIDGQQRLAPKSAAAGGAATLTGLAEAIRSRWPLIALQTFLSAVVMLMLLPLMPQYYESSTRILFDPSRLADAGRPVAPPSAAASHDTAVVESLMRNLTSDPILISVIEALDLSHDPEFGGASPASARPLPGSTVSTAQTSSSDIKRSPAPGSGELLRNVLHSVRVSRKSESSVVEITVSTRDPEKSRRIADALASAYVAGTITGLSDTSSEPLVGARGDPEAAGREGPRPAGEPRPRAGNGRPGDPAATEKAVDTSRSRAGPQPLRPSDQPARAPAEGTGARILSPATRPTGSLGPTPLQMLALTALSALLLGVGTALGREWAEPTVTRAEQLRRILASHRVHVVPGLAALGASVSRPTDGGELLEIAKSHPTAAATRAIMTLAAELAPSWPGCSAGFVLVTALGHAEGKSSLALNLALAARELGRRVLLVDADAGSRNLSRLLAAVPAGAAKHRLTDLPGLDIRLARSIEDTAPDATGTTMPAGLQSSSRYDITIVDGGLIEDEGFTSFGAAAGPIVVVVRQGITRKSELRRIEGLLRPLAGTAIRAVLLCDD